MKFNFTEYYARYGLDCIDYMITDNINATQAEFERTHVCPNKRNKCKHGPIHQWCRDPIDIELSLDDPRDILRLFDCMNESLDNEFDIRLWIVDNDKPLGIISQEQGYDYYHYYSSSIVIKEIY